MPARSEKGADIRRLCILDMARCLDPDADREKTLISIPESLQDTSDSARKVDVDVSTPAQPGRRSWIWNFNGWMRA